MCEIYISFTNVAQALRAVDHRQAGLSCWNDIDWERLKELDLRRGARAGPEARLSVVCCVVCDLGIRHSATQPGEPLSSENGIGPADKQSSVQPLQPLQLVRSQSYLVSPLRRQERLKLQIGR